MLYRSIMKKIILMSLFMLGIASLSAQQSGKNVNIKPYPESVDVVSVTDFGAKGDSKTDDTNAFQKAMDSFGQRGGTVYIRMAPISLPAR